MSEINDLHVVTIATVLEIFISAFIGVAAAARSIYKGNFIKKWFSNHMDASP